MSVVLVFFSSILAQNFIQQILEQLDDKKTMWDVEVRKILDFAIQQILNNEITKNDR